MSKLALSALSAALAVAALALPSSANAATRAVVEVAYATNGSGGYVHDCAAQPVGAYLARVTSCYVERVDGSARLCVQVVVHNIPIGGTYWSQLHCTDPAAPGAATAGGGVFRV